MLLSAVLAVFQVAAPAAAVSGSVRDRTEGRPLAAVQVTESDAAVTTTDSTGRYRISALAPGTHHLRFSLPGYASLEVAVLLPASSSEARVDVQLTPRPVQLPVLQVVAEADARNTRMWGDSSAEIGRTRLDKDWLELRQPGDADVQRALAGFAGVQGRGESVASLHVRGGGASENLTLLDGIPLFSAVHYAGASSALNPDVIAGAELHSGVSSAQFGQHLAGVVELETREPGPEPFEARGSLGSGEVRQTASAYLPGIRSGLLLGARMAYGDGLPGDGSGSRRNGYGDLLSVATTRAGDGRLRFISFLAGNRLDFSSVSDAGSRGGASDERPAPGDVEEYPGAPRNSVSWRSHSQGITWTGSDTFGANVQLATWWAGSSAEASWLAPGGAKRLHSKLSEIGLSARATWPSTGGGTSVGASLVRPSTHYVVTPAIAPSSAAAGLSLGAAPVVGSVFAERQWRPSRVLRLSAGLRASTNFVGWAGLEPRITAMVEPDARTRVGIGIGRSHQVVQSVFNDESALGMILGFDLPVAAEPGALPVARADQLEALVERGLGNGLDLSLTGYVRRTSGLALGAASTLGLFPGDSVVVGRGIASGVTGALGIRRGRLSGRTALTVGRNVRTFGGTEYDASYGHGTSLTAELGYRFLQNTRLLLRFNSGAHQPASIVAPGFEWQPLREAGDLAGTPENLPGGVNATRLPAYARLDLGLRRPWRTPDFMHAGDITTGVSIANVLGRANVLGFIANPDGSLRVIRSIPRTLVFEVGWHF